MLKSFVLHVERLSTGIAKYAQLLKNKVPKDTKEKLKEIMDKAKSLQTRTDKYEQDGENDCKILEEKRNECQNKITASRQEINKILDKMEKEILESLDKTVNEQLQAIEKQILALSVTLKALSMDINTTENANKTTKEEIMFAADVKISNISKGMQQMEVEFQRNKNLTDRLNSMEGLARIETCDTADQARHHCHIGHENQVNEGNEYEIIR